MMVVVVAMVLWLHSCFLISVIVIGSLHGCSVVNVINGTILLLRQISVHLLCMPFTEIQPQFCACTRGEKL